MRRLARATSLLITMTAITALPVSAAPQDAAPTSRPALDAAGVETADGVVLVTDVVYAKASDRRGRDVALTMDVAFPETSETPALPAVVYVHGGGWRSGSKESGRPLIKAFARGGYLAVSVDYRLSGVAAYPAAVHDVKAAVRFLRTHAEELTVDPRRIGIWGHSAGGHLSALVGTTGNRPDLAGAVGVAGVDSAVTCVVSVSGPSDLRRVASDPSADGMARSWLGAGTDEERAARAAEASPIVHVDADDPPFLLVHGTADPLVPIDHARRLADALAGAGVACELHVVDKGGHSIRDPQAYLRVARFFDRYLGGAAAKAMR